MQTPPRILITAGPTQEPIDDVRYISNRSSGRMGCELARASLNHGFPTTLLLGPVRTDRAPHHSHVRLIRFRTSHELETRLHEEWPSHDVLFMAAAVADYRPEAQPPGTKLRRGTDPIELKLSPVPDLLLGLQQMTRSDQIIIGFALEPAANLVDSARSKLERKGAHAVIANPLETMDAEDIEAMLVLPDGETQCPADRLPKSAFAEWVFASLVETGILPESGSAAESK